ncbi:YlxR family protein [Helcococcus ovis]|uniref:YlxR family protein n=1 Tax=Helcococcus ovis TaxID=72026 RepID=A0A4R9C2E6_9FIRM|nr:YlxR family protein [Helcococcus ovis]TFF65450.1 YlxR family protein [Helcococcus ovis]TFF66086.1 YlxR family protein [Helcococcus ovis]TFF67850.1 YlxR family protein [Helcococcus ovis]WNZ02029.1 YlxR family protein [Helcococcus ovis]
MSNSDLRLRKCIVCKEQKSKKDLIRIVKDKEGNINIDYSGKLNGRGAYICKNKSCLNTAISKKLLNRHLKTNVDDKIYKELETM